MHLNFCVPGRKLIGRVRDDEHGRWRKYYDAACTPLARVLARPDNEVPAAVKARLQAQAAALDPLALQEEKERLVMQLLHSRSRAQQAADLLARRQRHTPRAARRHTTRPARHLPPRHAAPSLRLSSSLRGSAQARRSHLRPKK